MLASLNHPNIGTIYGLEEADGVRALVLELIEGPTLADRVSQGPIPIDEALPIARQIAEALEAAHEQGVIHRDLNGETQTMNIRRKIFTRMNIRRKIFTRLYKRSAAPEALAWHRPEPPALLVRALDVGHAAGRALDLGCGEGVCSAYLAQRGWSVVGVDFVPAALELARARVGESSAEVEFLHADVLGYDPPAGFDLVLDSGCLHHIASGRRAEYRARLDRWLLPGGDYVLVHFVKRHALDWRPASPRRVPREKITRFFCPLRLEAYEETVFDLPFPMGPRALAGVYWFRKA